MAANILQFNSNETEVLIFGPEHKLQIQYLVHLLTMLHMWQRTSGKRLIAIYPLSRIPRISSKFVFINLEISPHKTHAGTEKSDLFFYIITYLFKLPLSLTIAVSPEINTQIIN